MTDERKTRILQAAECGLWADHLPTRSGARGGRGEILSLESACPGERR
jgi:hypothetical protein